MVRTGKGQLTKDFHISEFKCHDGSEVPEGLIANVKQLAENLQVLRDYIKAPLHINSGYRTPLYNMALDGASPHSQHLLGKAADITTQNLSPRKLRDVIERLIVAGKMKQGGLGLYKGFVHYDIRGEKARWDFSKILSSDKN